MKTYKNLWKELYSYENLLLAFQKASTYNLRLEISELFEQLFSNEISGIEVNRLLHQEKHIYTRKHEIYLIGYVSSIYKRH